MSTKIAVTKIANIQCGKDIFNATIVDKQVRCSLNNIDIIGPMNIKASAPIIGVLVTSACRVPNAKVSIKGNPSYNDFLKEFIDTVSKSDNAKVHVLEEKPDEVTDNKPKEAKIGKVVLEDYKDSLKNYFEVFNNTLKLSEVLLKTKMPKNIYSFKDIDMALTKSKTANIDLVKNRENYELITEQVGHQISQVLVAVNSRMLHEPMVKNIVQASVNHISANFLTMKKLLASVVTSQYLLYDIDKNFKKHTGYPATWFFDPSVFYNFRESYKDASDSLIEAVRAEASVIRPLYAWWHGTQK